ncbi:MAG: hypothetical protein WDN00_07765 [Limisphaerales bacterium]
MNLTVPATGDYDLYLYSATPGLYGKPVILASSTTPGNGQNESFTYQSSTNTATYLVVKRISGSGSFNLVATCHRNSSFCPAAWILGCSPAASVRKPFSSSATPGPASSMVSAALLNADEFSIVSGTPFAIAAQDSANLFVQFAPLTTGSFTNNLAFVSNGGSSTNPVTGRAIATPMLLTPTVDSINFNFSFNTAVGFTYLIQFKNALSDPAWQTLDSQSGDGVAHTYSVPVASLPQRFLTGFWCNSFAKWHALPLAERRLVAGL